MLSQRRWCAEGQIPPQQELLVSQALTQIQFAVQVQACSLPNNLKGRAALNAVSVKQDFEPS